MPGSTDDFLRQMVKGNLKLVSYHRGTQKLDHAELQTMNVNALNRTSAGFRGPAIVPLHVFNEMVQLKLIAETGAAADTSRSTFYLTDAGRARALKD
jgi:hypothetical protein